jgi:hypothetical protein
MASVTPLDAITLAIAALGAVLGIINTWQALDQNRVKLRVSVRVAYFFVGPQMSTNPQFAIEVVNRSQFPLTVSEIGFELRDSKDVLALVDPIFVDGGKLPRRLESRSAFTGYTAQGDTSRIVSRNPSRGYAKTDSGEIARSNRRAFRVLIDSLRNRL